MTADFGELLDRYLPPRDRGPRCRRRRRCTCRPCVGGRQGRRGTGVNVRLDLALVGRSVVMVKRHKAGATRKDVSKILFTKPDSYLISICVLAVTSIARMLPGARR